MGIVLAVGVAAYFLIRIYLWFRNRKFIGKESVSWKRKISFFGVDLCIILAAILQPRFPSIGQMHFGKLDFVIQLLGLSIFIIGVFFSSWARLTLGRNWRPAIHYQSNQQQELVTYGPYAFSRHPIYAGMFLMGFGFETALLNWLFLGIIFSASFFYHQAVLEEKLLKKRFAQYEQYRAKTKMFLPKIF